MTRYLNIVSERVLDTKEGRSKIVEKVGTIKITDNGGWYVQFPILPSDDFRVFANDGEELPTIQ